MSVPCVELPAFEFTFNLEIQISRVRVGGSGLPPNSLLEGILQAINAAKAAIVLIGPRGPGNTQHYERDLATSARRRDPTFPIVPVILPENHDRPAV